MHLDNWTVKHIRFSNNSLHRVTEKLPIIIGERNGGFKRTVAKPTVKDERQPEQKCVSCLEHQNLVLSGPIFPVRLNTFFQRVWSWLRMNAGGVPNTCKSNGLHIEWDFGWRIFEVSGGRVSNAWRTCPVQGDNNQKWLLKPHKRTVPHGTVWKTPVVQDGSALD